MKFIKAINKKIISFRRRVERNRIFRHRAPRWMLWLFILNFSVFSIGNLLAFTVSFGKDLKIRDSQIDLSKQISDKYLNIAEKFSPIIYQEIEGDGVSDLITNFNYDNDWVGNNNWDNLDKFKDSLKPYIYYSVFETESHYFINYSIFHPRDWKGGLITKTLLRFVKILVAYLDPTQIVKMGQLSHENDLEGMMLVVKKGTEPITNDRVDYVSFFSHNLFNFYRSGNNIFSDLEIVEINNFRPIIYIDAKGHGLKISPNEGEKKYVVYKPKDADIVFENQQVLDYDILNIFDDFWTKALQNDKQMFGSSEEYNDFSIEARINDQKIKIIKNFGKIGSAFNGDMGVNNAAFAPWAWRELSYSRLYGVDFVKKEKLGEWFFDPATTLKQKYNLGESISEVYLFNPYFGLVGEKTLK